MSAPQAQETETVVGANPTTGSGERILVVDDEESIRLTLEDYLTMSGHDVDTAPDGSSAVEMISQRPYDLVLCDLKMPGMDGLAVTEWVRETHPDVVIIMMTAHASVETSVRALRLGAHDYFLKPFTLDEIDRTIRNCLEHRRLANKAAELQETTERLRHIEQVKDDLLATVSHEFRTPLTSMQGFLSIMSKAGLDNLSPAQKHAMQAIGDGVNRLTMMVSNLLTMVEHHDGAGRPTLQPVSATEFLAEFLQSRDTIGGVGELKTEVEDSVSDTFVLLNRNRFPLVLTNLLDNSFKFAREGTSPEVLLRLRREGNEMLFEVHDDGIGITQAMGQRMFDRFTQADMTSTRTHSGSGLGLAVARSIVTSHEGTVRLVPPVLGGTSVRVSLPAIPSTSPHKD